MTKGRKNVRSAAASLHDTKAFFTLHLASNLVSALLSTLVVRFDVATWSSAFFATASISLTFHKRLLSLLSKV